MIQQGLTGDLIIKRWDLFDDDIFKLVIEGLQPYSEYWELILPPGSESLLYELADLTKKKCVIESEFPGIQYAVDDYNEWRALYVTRKKVSQGKFENTRFPDGTTAKIRIRYNSLIAKMEKLQNKCSWKKYKLPKNDAEKDDVKELLLNARYKIEDVKEMDAQYDNQIVLKKRNASIPSSNVSNEPEVETFNTETFIRSLQVSPVSDTEIKIRAGGKRAKIYEMKDLGFNKENSKVWKELIRIIRSEDHLFHVGKARGTKGVRETSYDVLQKILSQINGKLVPFLNENYQAQLPKGFKVYERAKTEGPGKYRFKFEINKHGDAYKKSFEELSKDNLLSQIEMLSDKYKLLSEKGDEESETQIYKIKDQLNVAVEVACNNKWIGRNQALGYLKSQNDSEPV